MKGKQDENKPCVITIFIFYFIFLVISSHPLGICSSHQGKRQKETGRRPSVADHNKVNPMYAPIGALCARLGV
jgi:hypothetical protein